MKKHISFIIVILILCTLCACGSKQPSWPGYVGTMDGYTYCYTEGRDLQWEEDILYLAESFLADHPYLSNKDFMIHTASELFGTMEYEYTNVLYNDSLRSEFLSNINALIPQIPKLTDAQILYELKRIVASVGDIHTNLTAVSAEDMVFPLAFEHITDESGVSLYAVRVPEAYESIYLGKLTAINDVSIEEILEKLSAFTPAENDHYFLYATVKPRSTNAMLTLHNALQAIGVVKETDTSAAFTFETTSGSVTQMVDAIPITESKNQSWLRHPMATEARLIYHQDSNYWYELLENDVLYVRFSSMYQDSVQSFDSFLTQVASVLRNAENPLRLILDFRYNGGGIDYSNTLKSFSASVNRCATDGVFILINGGSASAGVYAPFALRNAIDGAVLAGSPTAQLINCPADSFAYILPNSGYNFRISSEYFRYVPSENADALYPDVTIYQTWDDYLQSVDSVLHYALSQ